MIAFYLFVTLTTGESYFTNYSSAEECRIARAAIVKKDAGRIENAVCIQGRHE